MSGTENYELRSDTFTRPTAAMREAMRTAAVGNDVWEEDPTVRELEARAAALVGKEAALFVPSGTMGNAIGVRLHAGAGDEAYAHERSHVLDWEGGGPAALWGVQVRTVPGERGVVTPETLAEWLPFDPADDHVARPRLLCLENTHMHSGGRPWPMDALSSVSGFARERGLAVHLDGARVFNAAVALGVEVSEIAASADTVQFCLSKGLGAPVGSILAGERGAIRRGRRIRKLLGGGMTQAGVLAAAGLYALDHHVDRLADDHANARRLAEGLAAGGRLAIDLDSVQTNVVMARVVAPGDSPEVVCADLAGCRVLAAPIDRRAVRFVTSLEIDAAGIEAVVARAAEVLDRPAGR